MSGGNGKLTTVHVGEETLSEKHTIRFVFHNFAKLPNERGESTASSPTFCHGHEWMLNLYPRGDSASSIDPERVSVHLQCTSVRDNGGEVKARLFWRLTTCSAQDETVKVFSQGDASSPIFRCARRSRILCPSEGFLVDGNLVVEVDIQVYANKLPAWTPKTTLQADMLKILESAKETGDVKFQVGGEEFPAHSHILKARAPALAALAEEDSSDTPIPIEKVTPSAFRALLRYAYADDVPRSDVLRKEARELLHIADFCACRGLKLAAEAELVASGLGVESAADMVLLGDATNCALLKEAATDFFAANPTSVMASSGWANVTESAPIMKELWEVAFPSEKRSAPCDVDTDERDYKRSRVSYLRQQLDEKGLDVDGSRQMLIDRLEKEYPLIVRGAGAISVNGGYRQDGYFDGACRYAKAGIHDGREVTFSIFCCRLSDDTKRWFISIVPRSLLPGTNKDIDFYSAPVDGESHVPPENTWSTMANGMGDNPAPVLVCKSDPGINGGQE